MSRNSFWLRAASGIVGTLLAFAVHAQTTAGIGTTIVFPLTAQTTSFASEVTLFNPGASAMTASVSFHEATNSSTPGRTTTCSDVPIGAGRSAQIVLTTQCDMTAASHFGLLIVADKASPQSHNFYGYMRVQNPQGIGFSVEGFPVENFNNQVSEATGLIKQAAAPGYQTNCFVGSLDQPVNYTVKLFNGASGAQIGTTLTGSLAAYKQFRYLDVFGSNGVNAPAGDQFNVRAEFTQTSGGSANLIGFCTVQDNTSFGADFRVAKSYGSPSGTFFAQGGNAFGTTAVLGTTDNNALNIIVNGARVMRFELATDPPNIIGGSVLNGVVPGISGATIGGGGTADTTLACPSPFACRNVVTDNFGTVGGGAGNLVGSVDASTTDDGFGTVAGGQGNISSGFASAVGGGYNNTASGRQSATVSGGTTNTASAEGGAIGGGQGNTASGVYSTVGGGFVNTAGGNLSTVPGGDSNSAAGANSVVLGTRGETTTAATGSFVFSDASGTGLFGSGKAGEFLVAATGGIGMWTEKDYNTGCKIPAGSGTWTCSSSRELKHDFAAVDASSVLSKVVALPITTWRYKTEVGALHLGPVAEDFRAAFGLGGDDRSITTSDESGIALAAIQGLDIVVTRALRDKDAELKALKERLTQIETALAQLQTAKQASVSAVTAIALRPM